MGHIDKDITAWLKCSVFSQPTKEKGKDPMLPCSSLFLLIQLLWKQTRWLSVIKPWDSLSLNQITAGWYIAPSGSRFDMFFLCTNTYLLQRHNITGVKIKTKLLTMHYLCVCYVFWPDTQCNRAASVQKKVSWRAWGRGSNMRSYWDNWLLPCNNGREGDW